jgi:hypothetical protein
MGLCEGFRETILSCWHSSKVNVIAHQAVSQYAEAVLIGMALEEREIEDPIAIGKEYPLPPVASLNDMMGTSGNNDTSDPAHG